MPFTIYYHLRICCAHIRCDLNPPHRWSVKFWCKQIERIVQLRNASIVMCSTEVQFRVPEFFISSNTCFWYHVINIICQCPAELCPRWITTINVYWLKCLLVTKQRCVEITVQRSSGSFNILINLGKLNLGFIWFLVPGSGDECRVEDDTYKICGACGSMHCNGTLYHLQQICEAASCAASKRAV